ISALFEIPIPYGGSTIAKSKNLSGNCAMKSMQSQHLTSEIGIRNTPRILYYCPHNIRKIHPGLSSGQLDQPRRRFLRKPLRVLAPKREDFLGFLSAKAMFVQRYHLPA